MKTVAGVSSGRYGYKVPGCKSSPQGKVPKDFSNEELNEGMTSSVAGMSAIVLKKRVVGYGNRVEGSTDIGQKLDYLSKQISAVGEVLLWLRVPYLVKGY
jgi:hypothetical protein